MSKLEKLLGKPKKFVICGEEFELTPLKVKDMSLFANENATKEEQLKASKEIIKLSLKPSMPDITDAEVDALDVKVFTELMQAINEVNGFTEDNSAFRKIKEQINRAKP